MPPEHFPTPSWAYHSSAPPSKPQSTRHLDPFYGHKQVPRLCLRFHLFACPKYPFILKLASKTSPLHCLRPPSHEAAFLRHLRCPCPRLKARFHTARGSLGHCPFVSAFIPASKVICDDTYSKQGMFQLREINQIEREMCHFCYDWTVQLMTIRHVYTGLGPVLVLPW
ncbi:hypothetical protein M405DRAFT_875244 [Rhizopogon salebrosus TDB-379]|nr:hypothetical protein M405DRAFT_875244 [Rhizopogon salebrosus TDB-379]